MMPFLEDYRRTVILADMENVLGVPHQTIKKHADKLVASGILIEERKPKNIFYSLNTENQMVINYLSIAEKIRLEEALEKSILLKRLYEILSPIMGECKFLIFGSFAKDYKGEDMDVLALGNGKGIKEIAKNFEKTYGKRIHLIHTTKLLQKSLLKEVIKKHIILNNFEYFVRIFWESA